MLFELKEPVILAQGIAENPNRVHLAYLKKTGELCYSIVTITGEHQTMTLGKLDTRNSRYDRLILLPVEKVIHIFYAASHEALPDVWRINHLLWNGQTWKSAQLGDVVHPRHPLYHVFLDSKSNLHLLMMTFLGNHSVLLSNFFNGSYHIWAKNQESLTIPREVIDMAALITPNNTGCLFWGAKQPGSDKFEIGFATQPNMCDFTSAWRIEPNPVNDLNGPWKGFGVLNSEGILNMLLNTDQERLFQFQFKQKHWTFAASSPPKHSTLHLIQKTESVINYTEWLLNHEEPYTPLFPHEIQLSFELPENSIPQAPIEASNSVPVFKQMAPSQVRPALDPRYLPKAVHESESSLGKVPGNENIAGARTETEIAIEAKVAVGPAVDTTVDTAVNPEPVLDEPDPKTTHETGNVNDSATLLSDINEKLEGIPESLRELLQEKTASLIDTIEYLTLQSLETQEALTSLEKRVDDLIASQELKRKKGFWARWLTSMKE